MVFIVLIIHFVDVISDNFIVDFFNNIRFILIKFQLPITSLYLSFLVHREIKFDVLLRW